MSSYREKAKMKILVVCQHYWPEPYRLSDLCEEMVKRGHKVHVITDIPNYPKGNIFPGYGFLKKRNESRNGVTIHRSLTIPRKNNILFRFLNYYSFSISSTAYATMCEDKDFDIVLSYQSSPVMMASGALAYANKYKKKCVLYCLDLWPASLSAGGIKKGNVIYKYFHHVSRKIYHSADILAVTSNGFKEYLSKEFGLKMEEIHYLPQYADDETEYGVGHIRKESRDLNLLFAGNIGKAQCMDIILEAADYLKNDYGIKWHIAGDGSELERLKEKAKRLNLNNIQFYGYLTGDDLQKLFHIADGMLITLISDEIISKTLPLKMQSYMAAGKPIIASANGEIPRVINAADCGFISRAESTAEFTEAIKEFIECPNREKLGKNARAYYNEHFSKHSYMKRFEELLSNTMNA